MLLKIARKGALEDLYAVLDGIPADRYTKNLHELWETPLRPRLSKPVKHHANVCGSLGCAAGWAYLSPRFNAKYCLDPKCDYVDHDVWTIRYLAKKASIRDAQRIWDGLFSWRGGSEYDLDNCQIRELSDKQLCLYRILRALGWSIKKAHTRVCR